MPFLRLVFILHNLRGTTDTNEMAKGREAYTEGDIQRMSFTIQWPAAFRIKSFKLAVIKRNWFGGTRGRREVAVGD